MSNVDTGDGDWETAVLLIYPESSSVVHKKSIGQTVVGSKCGNDHGVQPVGTVYTMGLGVTSRGISP